MTARTLDSLEPLKLMQEELAQWAAALHARGVAPCFGSILVGGDMNDQRLVDRQHGDCAVLGIGSVRRDLPAATSYVDVEAAIDELNADPACTGYVVRHPFRRADFALRSRADPAKDVEGLHPYNLGKLVSGAPGPLPCAPVGILELLRAHNVPIGGVEVCIVGRGQSVGRPLALLLTRRSENATVTVCHTGTRDLAAAVRRADIVVAAAGVPGLITADMVKPGATVVDVGLSDTGGQLVGDVADDVNETAGWVSSNPGGVEPMTRAALLFNILLTAERSLEPAHA